MLTPNHIVLLSDGSRLASTALPLAKLAAQCSGATQVTILRVLEKGAATEPDRTEAETSLDALAEQLSSGTITVRTVVAEGPVAKQILAFCEGNAVDLVVLATHGRAAAKRWPLGSIARKVVFGGGPSFVLVPSPCSVEVSGAVHRVVVPLDCSPRAERVLPLVKQLANQIKSEVVLAHVVPEPDLTTDLPVPPEDIELAARLTARSGRRARCYLENVAGQLTEAGIRTRIAQRSARDVVDGLRSLVAAENPDLVLLSAHGSECRRDEPYGSVTSRLLGALDWPLWIAQDLPATAWRRADVV